MGFAEQSGLNCVLLPRSKAQSTRWTMFTHPLAATSMGRRSFALSDA